MEVHPAMMRRALCSFSAVCALLVTTPGQAQPPVTHWKAPLKSSSGQDAGTVAFDQQGTVLRITLDLHGLPPGVHGIHVHTSPQCEGPEFKTAGPHFDPVAHQHENVTVAADGTAAYTYTVAYLSLGTGQPNDILGGAGHSYMLHEKADDMVSDPTGNAGSRIACAVIAPPATPPPPAP